MLLYTAVRLCCGFNIGALVLGCHLGRCLCCAEVSTGHPHPCTPDFHKKEMIRVVYYKIK